MAGTKVQDENRKKRNVLGTVAVRADEPMKQAVGLNGMCTELLGTEPQARHAEAQAEEQEAQSGNTSEGDRVHAGA
jgi:hypothetical protein